MGFPYGSKNRARLAVSNTDWSQRDFYDESLPHHHLKRRIDVTVCNDKELYDIFVLDLSKQEGKKWKKLALEAVGC